MTAMAFENEIPPRIWLLKHDSCLLFFFLVETHFSSQSAYRTDRNHAGVSVFIPEQVLVYTNEGRSCLSQVILKGL